jgi:hypothetical protein
MPENKNSEPVVFFCQKNEMLLLDTRGDSPFFKIGFSEFSDFGRAALRVHNCSRL